MSARSSSPEHEHGRAFEPFRYRDYRLFWIGGTIANAGRWMQLLTLQKIIFDLTGSEAWAGAVGFVNQVPTAVLGPVSAAISDRYPRRKVLLATQSAYSIVAAVFMVVWLSGVRSPTVYLLFGLGTGTVSALNLPVWQAFVGNLVPRSVLTKAITLNSAQFNMARAAGPALGGVILAVWGPGVALGVNALAYGAVLLALVLIRTETVPRARQIGTSMMGDFADAVRLVRSVPGVARSVSLAFLVGFLATPLFSMIVVFAEDVFDVGDGLFGLLMAVQGLGAVAAAPFVSASAGRVRLSRLSTWALMAYGAALLMVAATDIYVVGLVAVAFVGAAHLSAATAHNSALQLQVPDEDRGKVLAVYLTVLMGSAPVGSLLVGFVAELTSPRLAIAGSAILLLAAVCALRLSGRMDCLDDDSVDMAGPAGSVASAQSSRSSP